MSFFDDLGGFIENASDIFGDVSNIVDSFQGFGSSPAPAASTATFPNWFPPIFQPPTAPTAPPASIAATPGSIFGGTAPLLIGGAIVLVLLLR